MNLFYDNSELNGDFVDENLKNFAEILNNLSENLQNVDTITELVNFYLDKYKHLFVGRKIISIDGNIGIGKTYFLKKLMLENKSLCLISEPVEYWSKIKCSKSYKNCLELYYESLNSKDSFFLFKFQLIVMVSKLLNIINKFSLNTDTVFISERCFLTDKWVFVKIAKAMYTEMQLEEYEKIHTKIIDELYLKTSLFFVYLNAETEEEEIGLCLYRIKQRNRDGEDKISEDYLIKIQKAYLELMSMSHSLAYIKNSVTIGQDFCIKPNIWNRLIEKLFE
ncbi:unnamed protein product [Brachionus calyciflorus]|uniref:Deoxynucleoside kinase domain-containing protein n=1 Tax=Brachionus calyciflorus TaxID=104777 RepID=A0A814C3F8_9BILA|nr:unnamed protein product [Brachionus calyciflorus]